MEKIAIINSGFDYGSTGSLSKQLYEFGKSKGYDMYAFYGRGKKYTDCNIIKIDSELETYIHKGLTLLTGLQGYYSNNATTKLLKVLEKKKIRHIIFLNLHGYYINEKRLFDYCRKNKVKIVYIMPDEFAGLGKCCYCENCVKFKDKCGQCPQVHEYPKSLIFDKSRKILQDKILEYKGQNIVFAGPKANLNHLKGAKALQDKRIEALDWGIDLDTYHYFINKDLYEKYNIPVHKILILTVAKFSMKRKGVKEYFFGAAKKLEKTNYHFINIGYDGNIPEEQMPKNMTVIPYVNDQNELAEIYSMSDLYILASTSDTQPMSALIAFGCETPVACFYASGLKYISNGDTDIVKYTDEISVDGLAKVIQNVNKKDLKTRMKCREYAQTRYSKEIFNHNVFQWLFGQ